MPFLFDVRTGKDKWFESCGAVLPTSKPYPIYVPEEINPTPSIKAVRLRRGAAHPLDGVEATPSILSASLTALVVYSTYEVVPEGFSATLSIIDGYLTTTVIRTTYAVSAEGMVATPSISSGSLTTTVGYVTYDNTPDIFAATPSVISGSLTTV